MKKNITNYVFPILRKDGDGYEFIGTGFFLERPNIFITAAHVLIDSNAEVAYALINGDLVPLNQNEIYREYREIDEQVIPYLFDLMIFRMELNVNGFYRFAKNPVDTNTALTSSGFHEKKENIGLFLPIVDGTPDSTRLILDNIKHSVIHADKALIQSYKQYQKEIEPIFNNCFTCNASVPSGMSGSPLLDANNDFYGIAIMSVIEWNQSIYLHKDYVLSILHRFILQS